MVDTTRPRPRPAPRALDLAQSPSAPAQAVPQPRPAPPAPQMTGAVGYTTVRRTAYDHTQKDETESVRVPIFGTCARVTVSGSVTQNLGDYNSARVEVTIEMPCLPETSEVDRVYSMLSERVDTMLKQELALATGQTLSPHQTH